MQIRASMSYLAWNYLENLHTALLGMSRNILPRFVCTDINFKLLIAYLIGRMPYGIKLFRR